MRVSHGPDLDGHRLRQQCLNVGGAEALRHGTIRDLEELLARLFYTDRPRDVSGDKNDGRYDNSERFLWRFSCYWSMTDQLLSFSQMQINPECFL